MRQIILPAILALAMVITGSAYAATPPASSTPSTLSEFNTLLPPPPTAQTTTNVAPHIWNLRDVDIRTVIEEVSKDTGKNFIVDPRVQGKVTLISTSPMTGDELYQAFLAVLATQGFTAVSSGNVIKIVPTPEANFNSIPAFISHFESSSENFGVQVFSVQNVNAAQLVPLLRPLLPTSSQIIAYAPSNALIVTGTASKMAQVQQIIDNLDQQSASNIEIIPLNYANATEVVDTLKTLLPTGTTAQMGLGLAADNGANSVLVSGPANERQRIRALVQKLDVLNASSTQQNGMTVVHLRYLNAEDLVPVLRSIASGVPIPSTNTASANDSGNPTAPTPSSSSDANENAAPSNINYGYLNTYLNKLNANNNDQSSYVVGNNPDSDVQIEAEVSTNSVIISAPSALLKRLIILIHRLDTRPQQVLVEAIIVEVNEKTLQKLGIQWGSTLPGGVNMLDSFTNIAGAGLGVGVVDFGRIRALINALATDSATNILSTPSLVVLDNQEAKIKVGQKVSFTTGQYATSATQTTVTPFTTADRQDVALELSVTPQIGPDGSIRFLIKQTNETLTATSSADGNPITNEANLDTSVIMNNGQILVLGGLISNDLEETIHKVPLLGDIPVLGRVFQSREHSLDKKNLMIFLHPVILNDQETSDYETSQRYTMMRELELQRQRNADVLLPPDSNPVMHQWHPLPLPVPFSTSVHATT